MKKQFPGSLKDYAFLSCPESEAVFLVERDGVIWQQHDGLVYYREQHVRNAIFCWTDYAKPNSKWSWLDNCLPVLCIDSISLFALGNKLYLETENEAFEFPGGEKISKAQIQRKIEKIRNYWRQRFVNLEFCGTEWIVNALKMSFVFCECAYTGLKPHYGVAFYGKKEHDGFPPTTIRMVENYLLWGETARASQLLNYYLENYVDSNSGEIKYYGPSLAEYGMLLELASKCGEANITISCPLARAMTYMLDSPALNQDSSLLAGSPEADEAKDIGVFIHNNAWFARGLKQWGQAAENIGFIELGRLAMRKGNELFDNTRKAINAFKKKYSFIPFRLDGAKALPDFFYESRSSGYANYRYYPELLESGILSREEAKKIVEYRSRLGGQEFGMTTIPDDIYERKRKKVEGDDILFHYDNWTLISYLKAMLKYGFYEEFEYSLQGHINYHTSQDIFMTYEQARRGNTFRNAYADFCIPSQLVLPMAWKLSCQIGLKCMQKSSSFI